MKNRAFTLVEVLVALVILAITAAGLTSVFVSSSQWLSHGRALMGGIAVGKSFLDPLAQDVSQRNWNGGNCLTGGGGCPAPVVINNILYTPSAYATSPVGAVTPNWPYGRVRRVQVTVNWPVEARF